MSRCCKYFRSYKVNCVKNKDVENTNSDHFIKGLQWSLAAVTTFKAVFTDYRPLWGSTTLAVGKEQ